MALLLPPLSTGKQGRGAQGAGGLGPAALELGGGLRKGEKEPGGKANRSPASPCAGVERGGPATEASSGGWRC